MIRKTVFLLCLALFLTGCQTISERKQADRLQEVLSRYGAVIRWGSLDKARTFLEPELAKEAVIEAPARDMRVTHYEVVQGPAMLDGQQAIQTVLIQYVFEDTQVVRELVDQQVWRYDGEAEQWYLTSPLPTFK